MDSFVGKMLDNRYEILERIGTGGMAVVYKARDHRLNRLIAIKILKSDLAQDEDFRRRFNAESQAVAQLSHPNIVSVYDVSKSGEVEYIVMELIDGITLKQYMEKRGQLNWRESLHFITQIMRGLSHAHSRGIIHRDIKPQNIMILRDGSVKVTDFGIACLENSAQTLTQEALGSVHYLSPEQARGDRTDARSDIYSAGVVLYEMLTNRLPFEGDSAVSVAIQHLSSIPLAPREINKEIPEPLELICMKAMAPDLEKRYVSAEAMIADLEAFRKNPGVDLNFDMDDILPEEEDEPTRLLRTAGAAAQVTSRRPQREDASRGRSDQTKKKSKRTTMVIIGGCVAAAIVLFFLLHSIIGSFSSGSQEYKVPNVLGYTVEEAQQMDGVKDVFKIVEDGTAASSEYETGTICQQDPSEGDTRKAASGELIEIHVTVSSGTSQIEMPDVTKEDQRDAVLELKKLMKENDITLTIDDSEEYQQYSDDVTTGFVISTEPEAGSELKNGDTVKLYVSKGPEHAAITIPDFRQMNIDSAKKQAKDTYKLVVKTVEKADSAEAGKVIDQDLAVGSAAKEGDTITFTVSTGPEETTSSEVLTIPLPTDRDTVQLKIVQDGTTVVDNITVDCAQGSYAKELTGTGTSTVEVYFDNQLYNTYQVTFGGD